MKAAATLIPLLGDNPDGYQDKLLSDVQAGIDGGIDINIGVNVAPVLALLARDKESPEKKTKIADRDGEAALVNEVNVWIDKAKAATPVPIDSICKATTLIATRDLIALKKFRDVGFRFCTRYRRATPELGTIAHLPSQNLTKA